MGKWTPDYIDDVLHSKIKNLVSGAIKRVALEKTEPTITYEDFVHDLETGDSLTTSLIEVLVKELAERRTRPNIDDDRRIITEHSARILHQLAERNPNYRERIIGRHFPRRRSATMADYLTAPPFNMNTGDGDIFDHMLDNGAIIQGARINSDLYDAYGGGQSTRAISSPSPPVEALSPVPHPIAHAHFRNEHWSTINSSGSTTLTRQPSLRRPTRSRTVDFNEFTRRRRSTTRDNQNHRVETSDSPEHWEPFPHASARRFFPFVRTHRLESSDSWIPNVLSSHDADDSPYAPEPSNAPWFNLTPPMTREPATMEEVLAEAEVSDERAQAAPTPRLRRGSMRTSESMLSRHVSPIPHVFEDTAPPAAEPAHDHTHASVAETTGYPTPSSTEHEFFT